MRKTEGTLTFATLDQKVLWDCELRGQLSDGAWENATPYDHWEPWCRAEVTVDPEDIGRDFEVKKDGYGFTRRDLLDVVEDRMMEYVRVARTFGYVPEDETDEVTRGMVDYAGTTYKDKASPRVKAAVKAAGGWAAVEAVAADESIYSKADLLADLRAIGKTIKIIKGEDADQLIESENQRKRWLGTIHIAQCAKVRNAQYKRYRTDESVVQGLGRSYGDTLHDCIPQARRTELYSKARAYKDEADKVIARRNLVAQAASAEAAAYKARQALGTLTPAETAQYNALIERGAAR